MDILATGNFWSGIRICMVSFAKKTCVRISGWVIDKPKFLLTAETVSSSASGKLMPV